MHKKVILEIVLVLLLSFRTKTAQCRDPDEKLMCESLRGQADLLCYRLTVVYFNNGTACKKKSPYLMTLTIMFYFLLENGNLAMHRIRVQSIGGFCLTKRQFSLHLGKYSSV